MHQLIVQVAGGSDRLESIGESLQEVLQDMKNGSGCAAEHHAREYAVAQEVPVPQVVIPQIFC